MKKKICTGWRPRTSGGRLRFARAITYLLHHRLKETKGIRTKKTGKILCLGGKKLTISQATHMPTSRHFRGITAHQTYIIKYRNLYLY